MCIYIHHLFELTALELAISVCMHARMHASELRGDFVTDHNFCYLKRLAPCLEVVTFRDLNTPYLKLVHLRRHFVDAHYITWNGDQGLRT